MLVSMFLRLAVMSATSTSPGCTRSISDAGPNCLIWGKINGEATGSSGKRKYEEFFVGTQQQFKNQGKSEKYSGP